MGLPVLAPPVEEMDFKRFNRSYCLVVVIRFAPSCLNSICPTNGELARKL